MAFALILIMGELKGQLFITKTKNPQAQRPAGKAKETKQAFKGNWWFLVSP